MKSQQPMVPGGNLACPSQIVEHMTFCPYMQARLVDLGKQFQQWVREPLAAWLLCLWDLGVDSIMCADNEMEKLASITTHPSLHQWLQNNQRNARGQGSHSLLEWIMAVICMVWVHAGYVPDTVSKWQSY